MCARSRLALLVRAPFHALSPLASPLSTPPPGRHQHSSPSYAAMAVDVDGVSRLQCSVYRVQDALYLFQRRRAHIGDRRPPVLNRAYGLSPYSPSSVRSRKKVTPASNNWRSFCRASSSYRDPGYSPANSLPGSTQQESGIGPCVCIRTIYSLSFRAQIDRAHSLLPP